MDHHLVPGLGSRVFISIDCNACHIVALCTCDIHCVSTHPRERDPSSVVLPEDSSFSMSGDCEFFLTKFVIFVGLRIEGVVMYRL